MASMLLDRHGDGAPLIVAERSGELADEGKAEGSRSGKMSLAGWIDCWPDRVASTKPPVAAKWRAVITM